jgi:hypothetical protein
VSTPLKTSDRSSVPIKRLALGFRSFASGALELIRFTGRSAAVVGASAATKANV